MQISATGVHVAHGGMQFMSSLPCYRDFPQMCDADTGGIWVNTQMQVLFDGPGTKNTITNVFAAGDVCSVSRTSVSTDSNWFQMRLWSQARSMGQVWLFRGVVSSSDLVIGSSFFNGKMCNPYFHTFLPSTASKNTKASWTTNGKNGTQHVIKDNYNRQFV